MMDADAEAQAWGDLPSGNRLGQPLVALQVGEQRASLYHETGTGRIWHAITGIGGAIGPVDDLHFGWGATRLGAERVIYGPLFFGAVAAEASTAAGESIQVRAVPGAFIAVAPSQTAIEIRLKDAEDRTVWCHHILAQSHTIRSSLRQMAQVYWLGLKIPAVWLR